MAVFTKGSKGDPYPSGNQKMSITKSTRNKKLVGITIMLLTIAIIALGVGVSYGARHPWSDKDNGRDHGRNKGWNGNKKETVATPVPTVPTVTNNGTWWQPKAGETWNIILHNTPKFISIPQNVLDLDLLDTTPTTISDLKDAGHKVICYFSAGSVENWRSDFSKFTKADYGKGLKGWKGEYWRDTRRENVRNIMKARLDIAVQKKCDAVDPDNIDGYDNPTGLSLTKADAINYLTFLTNESHKRGLAIGLKNGGEIVKNLVDIMDFQVNESCAEYNECALFQPFIKLNKPVFHIEYKEDGRSLKQVCSAKGTEGFSTVLKNLDLDDSVQCCS